MTNKLQVLFVTALIPLIVQYQCYHVVTILLEIILLSCHKNLCIVNIQYG